MSEPDPTPSGPRIDASPTGSFHYVPGEVTVFGERARERAVHLVARTEDDEARWPVSEEDAGWFRVREVGDVLAVVEQLRAEGFVAQPNHVFWSHGCGHGCPPHPALAHALLHSVAHPFSGTPFSGTPFSGTPFSGTPFSGTPFSGTRPPVSTARPAAAPLPSQRTLTGNGSHPVVVVLDSGLATPRPQLLAQSTGPITGDDDEADGVIVGADGTASGPDLHLDPIAGHGTFIAGLIEQIAPGTTIHVQRILEPLGDVAESVLVAAIHAAVNGSSGTPPADIINISLGGPVMELPFQLRAAIGAARQAGVVVVASAGNAGTCTPTYPAALDSVIGVAALGPDGPTPWSNYGEWVDACAPGTDLVSAFFASFDGKLEEINGVDPDEFDEWALWSGTSFATPVVVGALAREMVMGDCDAREAVRRVLQAPHLMRIPCFGTVVNA